MLKEAVLEVLDRQGKVKNPLLSILIGAVTRAEMLMDSMDAEINVDEAKIDLRAFIDEIGVAKLYDGLILKLQLPLHTNEPIPVMLAYNEDRSLKEELSMDGNILSYFEEGENKIFVFARLWVDGSLQIVRKVDEQGW